MRKRSLQTIGSILFITLISVILGISAVPVTAQSASTEPVKIGMIADLTGPLAMPSSYWIEGSKMAVQDIGTILGRPIDLIIEDDNSNPDQALDKARKLGDRDKVAALMGPLNGGSAVSVLPYENSAGIPSVMFVPHTDQTTTMSDWTFQPYGTLRQTSYSIGVYAAKVKGYKTAVTFGLDFTPGYEYVQGFTEGFEANGGKVIENRWVELTATEFSPYILGLPKSDCTAIWMVGNTTIPFYMQYAELRRDVPIVDIFSELDFSEVKKGLKNVLPRLSVCGLAPWVSTDQSPEAQSFVEKYSKLYGRAPNFASALGYSTVQVIAKAIENAGTVERSAIKQALYDLEMDTLYGPIKFNSDRLGLSITRIFSVTEKNNGPYFKIIDTHKVTGSLKGDKVVLEMIE